MGIVKGVKYGVFEGVERVRFFWFRCLGFGGVVGRGGGIRVFFW